MNSQPHKGSNNTKSIPRPKPIIHTAKVFLRSLNINILTSFIFIILWKLKKGYSFKILVRLKIKEVKVLFYAVPRKRRGA